LIVGLKVFLITSDGDSIENHRHYRKAEKALATAQRRVSRKKKDSKRWNKARKRLAKKHLKVRRQRQDFHHKTAIALVRQYDVIYIEDLRVRNMVRNHHLAKSIADAGWSQFRTTLEYKAACAGKQVIVVEPAYTSQDCSGCGERIQKTLSVRTHVCTICGLVLDRDENAALNILRVGQALRGVVGMPATLKRESVGL
jgi:putative transposase